LGDTSGSLETLLDALVPASEGSSKFVAGDFSVELLKDNELQIVFKGDGGYGELQTITVQSSNAFVNTDLPVDVFQVTAILQKILCDS